MSSEHKGSVLHPLYDDNGEVGGYWVAMPDADIANLGKHRCDGVAWVCGDFAEVISTTSTFLSGVRPPEAGPPKPALSHEEVEKRVAVRAAKAVRRLVNTNRMAYMWTLTFCPADSKYAKNYGDPISTDAQKDYGYIRHLWKRFSRKLKTAYPEIRWLVVFELHDSEKTSAAKKGTYHLHFCTDLFLPWLEICEKWEHGNVRFDDFAKPREGREQAVSNPGAYVSKYISKSFGAENLYRKRYTCSRNILHPLKTTPGEFRESYIVQEPAVFSRERTFDFWNPQIGVGGIYGIIQKTYRIERKNKS